MKKKRASRTVTFLCCLLAVPGVESMVDGTDPALAFTRPALSVGAALGLLHLLVRPLLRLISAPLGCLTLGLFGMVIDVGLIYAAARKQSVFLRKRLEEKPNPVGIPPNTRVLFYSS